MGNRFASLDEYHILILGHGILAAMVFLFILPASVMIIRFRTSDHRASRRYHIYLNVLAVFMTTVVFILGFIAVGPGRSLTNPHHGIGVAIYVLILVQIIGGNWVRARLKHARQRLPLKLMLHQWMGRTITLLGIVQVPLGLTLYGSPRYLFILYALWMTFLLVLYFILDHRHANNEESLRHSHRRHEGTVIEERGKSGGIGRFLGPLAAGGAIAALLSRRKSKRESSQSRATEVISSKRHSSRRDSRRDSESFIEEEKYSEEGRGGGGFVDKLLAGGAVLGAGALAKSWWDRRRRNKDDEAYSAVAPDTPSRRRRARTDADGANSEFSQHGPILPGPGDPLAAATAISAAQPRPVTPRPAAGRRRADSYDSYDSRQTPSRRTDRPDHTARNTLLGGIGLGWIAKRLKDRKDRQEQERLDRIRDREYEDERRLEEDRRRGTLPPRYTGDGNYRRNHGRETEISDASFTTVTSQLSSSFVEPRGGGTMPPLAAGALPAAAAAGATISQSRSRHEIIDPVPVPLAEPRQWEDSGSEVYDSAGGRQHRRHSSRQGAPAEAATLLAEEERRRRDASRSHHTETPPVSVKVKVHGDPDRGITLRRLTEEEAAAERSARRHASRTRADSPSSLATSDPASAKRRYRRDENARRDMERAAEERVEAATEASYAQPLSPPRPAFAAGRPPKDSSYFSGPAEGVAGPSGAGTRTPLKAPGSAGSLGSPESHGTWSGVTPSGPSAAGTAATGGGRDPADQRRRRRLERNQRQTGTVEFT